MQASEESAAKQRTYVIAEAGVNHNGSLDLAYRLVDAAAEAGADAVKFQTFKAASLTSRQAPKAAYQDRAVGTSSSQLEMIRKLELGEEEHRRLAAHCIERGITFMSTPFDVESLQFLVELGVERLKVSSGDVTNLLLLRAIGATRRPCILSTGMATLADVEGALGALASGALSTPEHSPSWTDAYRDRQGQEYLAANVMLLHCTTEYPAPLADVNLRAMNALEAAFGLPVGYSDHTEGITIPIAAVARGAVLIEKHFTLDRKMEGPDHAASLEPGELLAMVRGIRDVERALGNGRKIPAPSEVANIAAARRSLVAARAIRKGERFTCENVTAKRPGTGISPMRYDEIVGSVAARDYEEDELITTQ
jgi:N-acetylneuraminate synthase